MKINPKMRSRGGFTLVELLVVISIIAALAGFATPMLMRQKKRADQTEAVSNAKQIGTALFSFEEEYGTFPDDLTAAAVKEATDTALVSGNSANDRFRQLIRAGIIDSEIVFYSKTAYTKKPDNAYETDAKALANGEVGFGMVVTSEGKGLSAAGNSGRPILVTPFTAACNKAEFDPDYYLGKAVVLKADNSVVSLSIVPTTKAIKVNGKGLLQDGKDTVWGEGNSVKFAYPKPKGGSTSPAPAEKAAGGM
jgi:prepilin-type N-terminal cleavage/methylation domain-containing protein